MFREKFLAMDAGIMVKAPIKSVPTSLIPKATIKAKIKRNSKLIRGPHFSALANSGDMI